jgi:uncharacterized membrane-anchored protein
MARPALRGLFALVAALAVLVMVNLSIAGKERLLSQGRVVYLELAPVDPRSLMQGDYMALNYQVANSIIGLLPTDSQAHDGRIVVSLDERSVAEFRRLEDGQPLAAGEIYLRYRVRGGRLKFASDAFFFQEGTAGQYESARYGRYRVDESGELLLTGLRGEDLRALGPESN